MHSPGAPQRKPDVPGDESSELLHSRGSKFRASHAQLVQSAWIATLARGPVLEDYDQACPERLPCRFQTATTSTEHIPSRLTFPAHHASSPKSLKNRYICLTTPSSCSHPIPRSYF